MDFPQHLEDFFLLPLSYTEEMQHWAPVKRSEQRPDGVENGGFLEPSTSRPAGKFRLDTNNVTSLKQNPPHFKSLSTPAKVSKNPISSGHLRNKTLALEICPVSPHRTANSPAPATSVATWLPRRRPHPCIAQARLTQARGGNIPNSSPIPRIDSMYRGQTLPQTESKDTVDNEGLGYSAGSFQCGNVVSFLNL